MEKKDGFKEVADIGEAGAAADPGPQEGGNPQDKLDALADMIKSLMQSQVAIDQEMEKESSRQDKKWRSMQHQFHQIQAQVREIR